MTDFLTWPVDHILGLSNLALLLWNTRAMLGLSERISKIEGIIEERKNRRGLDSD